MTTDMGGASAPPFSSDRIPTRIWDSAESLRAHILYALDFEFPEAEPAEPHDGHLVIVGSAPSVAGHVGDIMLAQDEGAIITCVNAAHDWLIDRGIRPDMCVLLDPHEKLIDLVTPQEDVRYFVASQCHPATFNALHERKVTLWHAMVPKADLGVDLGDFLVTHGRPGKMWMISGGGTAMLRSFNLGRFLGYRRLTAYGLDSSYAENGHHHVMPGQRISPVEMEVEYAGRLFHTNIQFASQAQDFEGTYLRVLDDCRIEVIGDGLIPWICETLNKQKFGVAA